MCLEGVVSFLFIDQAPSMDALIFCFVYLFKQFKTDFGSNGCIYDDVQVFIEINQISPVSSSD